MKTILEVLNLSREYLENKRIENPRREADALIGSCLDLTRFELYLNHEKPVQEDELEKCRKAIRRRGLGEPFSYIKGSLEFFDCEIRVNPHVLIPRQETEILVDLIANQLYKEKLENHILWDVCCGSGCIGIALKKKFPKLQVFLSDCSKESLLIAKENAENNQVDVQFLEGDLLKPFKGLKTHFLVCNPPYISQNDYLNLDKEVRDFEPKGALVAGETGIEYYKRLAEELPFFLHPGAKCWFEIGAGQGPNISALFAAEPYKNHLVRSDWAGHDRFFLVET